MATLAQLQAEPWWGREIVTDEMDWAGDELCRRTGRPRGAAGTKGDELHLYGGHRSQEWILNSAYCTSRSYTVQSGLTVEQARHIGALDFVPGAWGTATNRRLMVEQTGRLMAEMKAGRLEGVRELYGTLDGRTVTGWDNVSNRTVTSDTSHLDHWHLTFDRRRLTDRALMERVVAVALGEEDDMTPEQDIRLKNIERVATNADLTTWLLAKLEDTISGPKAPDGKSYPYENKLGKALKALVERPLVQAAPVDPAVVAAAVKAALSDPDVLAGVAKAVNDDHARRQQA